MGELTFREAKRIPRAICPECLGHKIFSETRLAVRHCDRCGGRGMVSETDLTRAEIAKLQKRLRALRPR